MKDTNNNHKISDVHFNYQDVRDTIDWLSAKAAAGSNVIPVIVLKKCRDSLSEPLTILWQKSPATGDIPDMFKLVLVIQ